MSGRASLAAWFSALLLSVGCGGQPAPEPPPPFSCATADAALGHPSARVVACDPLPGLPEIVQVALEEPGSPPQKLSVTVLVEGGKAQPAAGGPALGAFLDSLPPDRLSGLTMADVNGLLRAFGAFPERFGPRDWNFDMPGIGRSSFSPTPFSLVLYTSVPPPPEKVPNDPDVYRATLARDAGVYAWVVEQRAADGAWEPRAREPLMAEPASTDGALSSPRAP